jgi:hypothetical protein
MKTNENISEAAAILACLQGKQQPPTNPIVTWDGVIRLTSSIHQLGPTELVLFHGLDGFGDGWDEATPEQVLDYIADNCEPYWTQIQADLQIEPRRDGNYSLSVRSAQCIAEQGFIVSWDDYDTVICAVHAHVGVGDYDCNDTDAWVVLTPEQVEAEHYPLSVAINYTQHNNNNGQIEEASELL